MYHEKAFKPNERMSTKNEIISHFQIFKCK